MRAREWVRPPRHLLIAFLAVAALSSGALGWLAWQLLEQDEALEAQRWQERLEQAADRATAVVQRSLVDLRSFAGVPVESGTLPDGVSVVAVGVSAVTLTPPGSLPFVPVARRASSIPPATFAEGERLEFAAGDLRGAARVYSMFADARDPAVSAGALARQARVHRKLGDPDAALGAYDRLLQAAGDESVDGIAATLVARVGRASVYEEAGRTSDLRAEAAAFQDDLARARWPLVRSEYEFYAGQVGRWLGTAVLPAADALTRAEAVEWLWQNRSSLPPDSSRAVATSSGPAFLAWARAPDRLQAVVAGPRYLLSLRGQVAQDGMTVSFTDPDGRALLGDAPPSDRRAAIRTAASTRLPWTLHVTADDDIGVSPRRPLLALVFVASALVLLAGWYFILRAISRELRVSRLQADFVGAVSHEFRSPLTSLSHIAELLASNRMPSDDVRRQSFELLVRDTDRLRRLVEDLLDFGRFDAGAATLRFEPVDVSGLVRTIAADFEDRVAPQGYSIEVACPTTAVWAQADRDALSRALWNLLDNAVKYSPTTRTVWVTVDCADSHIAIGVRDQGIGIPAHEQREIFERFVRGAESKARRIRGTGIGLALVSHIVKAHGGEVRVASEAGVGSEFTMRLPAVAVQTPGDAQLPIPNAQGSVTG